MTQVWLWLLMSSGFFLGFFITPVAAQEDYQRGLELLQAAQYTGAIQRLQKALQQQPHEPQIAFALAVAHFQVRSYAEAFQAYQTALKQVPDAELKARIYSGLGDVSFALEAHEQAIGYYQQALFQHSEWLGVRLRLAESMLKQKYYASALQELTYILRYEPLLTEAYRLRSLVYLSQQDFERALQDLEHITKNKADKSFDFYAQLNWLYRLNQKWPQAIAIGRQMTKLWGASNPDSYRILGDSLLEQVQHEWFNQLQDDSPYSQESLDAYQRYTLIQPNNPVGYYKIGQLYQIKGHFDDAHLFYKKAYQLFPQHLPYLIGLLEIESAMGNYAQAYQTLVQQQASFATDIHYWEARLKFNRSQDNGNILNHLEQWLQKETKPEQLARGFFLKGICLHRQNAEAFIWQSEWQKTEALAPHLAETDVVRAERMKTIGKQMWAFELYRQAQQKRPEWMLPYQALGELYIQQQQWQQALPYLIQALFYGPDNYKTFRLLERTHLKLKQLTQVQSLYGYALKAFPDDTYFQQRYLASLQP